MKKFVFLSAFLFAAVSLPANECFIFDASPSVNTTENAGVIAQNVEIFPVKVDCTVTKVKVEVTLGKLKLFSLGTYERIEYCSNSNCNYKKNN